MPLPKNVHAWNEDHVCKWLVTVDREFKMYTKNFKSNGICGSDLLGLTKADLRQSLGITGQKRSSEDRNIIFLSIGKLKTRKTVQKSLSDPVMEWSKEHVGRWMDKIGLHHLRGKLVKLGITGSDLMDCEMNMATIASNFQIEDGADGAIFFRALRGLKSTDLTPSKKIRLSQKGTGLLHLGFEGGTQLHVTTPRSESKLSESYVSRSSNRFQLDRSVSRSKSDLPRRLSSLSGLSDRSDRSDSCKSDSFRSDSSIAALPPVRSPVVTPRTSPTNKFKPQLNFGALNGDEEDTDDDLYSVRESQPPMAPPAVPANAGNKYSNLQLNNMHDRRDDSSGDEFSELGKDRGREAVPLNKTRFEFSRTGTYRVTKNGKEKISINHKGMRAVETPLASRTKNLADEFIMLEELGSGAGGTVYKALHAASLRYVAVKKIKLDDHVKNEQVYKELQGLMSNFVPLGPDGPGPAPCPYLVGFYGAKTSREKRTVSLILEFMDGGDLCDFVKMAEKKRLDEKLIANLALGMTRGLGFIHKKHCVHRDVKPGNVLVHTNGMIKIADFGISKSLESTISLMETFAGTRIYMSPERLEGEPYTLKADVWSIGLTVRTLATGDNPLSAVGFWEVRDILHRGGLTLTRKDGCSPELCDFVNACLRLNPKDRPTCSELMEHSFIKKNMSSRSRKDPSSRVVRKLLSKQAKANAPSVAKVKEMCDHIAKFYMDHMLVFPSKDAIATFSEQCGSRPNKIKKRLRNAFDDYKEANKKKLVHRPLSSVSSRSESKLSESFKGKSLTPRARGASLPRVNSSSSPRSGSGFKPQIDFKALNGEPERSSSSRFKPQLNFGALNGEPERSSKSSISSSSSSRFKPQLNFGALNGDPESEDESDDDDLYATPANAGNKYSNLKLKNMNDLGDGDDGDEFSELGKVRGREAVPLNKTRCEFSRTGTFRVTKNGKEKISIKESGMQSSQTPLASRTKRLADEFIMLEELGSGAGGTVYKALHAASLRFVAVKKIRLDDNVKNEQVYKELQGLMSNFVPLGADGPGPAPCPYLVGFYGAKTSGAKRTVSLILEFMDGGDLCDFVKMAEKKRLDEKLIAHLAFGMARGLDFIHKRYSVHRDVKPGNVLVHTNGMIKIADFGIAKSLDSTVSMAETFTGTKIYMSPERLEGHHYNYTADVWSIGLTVRTLATGSNPLSTCGFWEVRDILQQGDLILTRKDGCSSELCDFVNSCLKLDPKDRPKCSELMEHSFIKKNMSSRSRKDPSSRVVRKLLSKQAKANAPSVSKVKKMCDHIAKFYMDRGLDLPSKSAMKTFSDECLSNYRDVKNLMKSAFDKPTKRRGK